jgi:hypothetical protein
MKALHLSCVSWLGIVWLFLCLQLVKETDGVVDGSEWQMTEALVKAEGRNGAKPIQPTLTCKNIQTLDSSRLWIFSDTYRSCQILQYKM